MEMSHQSKQLHRHAVPVGLVLLVLLTVSAVLMIVYPSGPTSSSSLTRGLVTQVIHVQRAPNGLAKVTTEKNQPAANSNFNDIGRAAQFTLSLQAAVPPRL